LDEDVVQFVADGLFDMGFDEGDSGREGKEGRGFIGWVTVDGIVAFAVDGSLHGD
jgi:hypothetical protein